MKDLCLCGHGRELHHWGFQHCVKCGPGSSKRFTCRPGACGRFTWDAEAEAPRKSKTTGTCKGMRKT